MITISADMSCSDGKETFFPTTMYAVIEKASDGTAWRWFDFASGSWRGAVANTAITPNKRLAAMIADRQKAIVIPYLLVACKHGLEDYSQS